MIRTLSIASLVGLLCAPTISIGSYIQVFNEVESAGGIGSPFLNTVAVEDGVAYAISGDSGPGAGANDTGTVVSYDGSTFTTIMTEAQWMASGADFDIFGSNGAAVVNRGGGDQLRFVNSLTNSIWEVDLVTGNPVEVVTQASIEAVVGQEISLVAFNQVLSDGTAFAYESRTDTILQITPGGFVFAAVTSPELTALTGSDLISSGFELIGSNLFFGSNTGDSIYTWDLFSDVGSVVLDTATIDGVTDDVDGNVGIDDLFLAPDGLMYFYEDDSDAILSFDPSDPAGTLQVVLSEAQLVAGPAGSDIVGQFGWWNGGIAWTVQGNGFYAVPEPTTGLLSVIALAGLAARRR